MVGASPDWHKASSFAMKYLQTKGYRVIPVNPRAAGKTDPRRDMLCRLRDIPLQETGPIDMVDIFRNSSAAGRDRRRRHRHRRQDRLDAAGRAQ